MNRRIFQTLSLIALASVIAVAVNFAYSTSAQSDAKRIKLDNAKLIKADKLTKDDVDRMMTELSNWGRWGK
ncbi:MAG: hypothetical protein AAB401_09430, partial [Acidobacteriota bacterium]